MSFSSRWHDDPARPAPREAARDLAVRALAPMTGWFVVVLAIGWALTHGPLEGLGRSEESINRALEERRDGFFDAVTFVFSWAGATASIVGIGLVVVGVIWWRTRQWWFAVVPLIAISLQGLVFFFTTLLIDRERPDVDKMDDSPPTSSYPSGHTGAATGLWFTLALLALRIRQPALRAVVVTLCLLVPFLVASARLYRGMHHLSDVTVALVDGTLAAVLAWGWLRRAPAAAPQTLA